MTRRRSIFKKAKENNNNNKVSSSSNKVTKHNKKKSKSGLASFIDDKQDFPRNYLPAAAKSPGETSKKSRNNSKTSLLSDGDRVGHFIDRTPDKDTSDLFSKHFGETEQEFNKRMDDEVAMILAQAKNTPDVEPEKEQELQEKKKLKRKQKDLKKKEKKRKLKEKTMEKDELQEVDKVEFGEVVMRPPALKTKARFMAGTLGRKSQNFNFLKKFAADGSKFSIK